MTPTSVTSDPDRPLLERLSEHLVPELKRYLAHHRATVEDTIATGTDGAGYPSSVRLSKAYDGLISALFHAARTVMTRDGTWSPVCVAAVGSYGRAALSPRSDLDVRLLHRKAGSAGTVAEAFLYPLWDAGLSVGHQVVAPDEMVDLAREDLPTATSLLDWRSIVGDAPELQERLLERAFQGVFGPGGIGPFVERLERHVVERTERYGGSVYLLEPDVKNGEGGLRDLDVAHWAARARWRVNDLQDLVRLAVLVPREWAAIDEARNFLFRLRNYMHHRTRRRIDRLSFELQEQVAVALGYGEGGPGVVAMMRAYYRHARTIAKAREMVLTRAKPPPRRPPRETLLGGGLKLTRSAVSLVDPEDLERDPALAMRLYDEAVRRDLPVYDFARHAVARVAATPEFCERLRESPEAAERFVHLCCVMQETKLRHGSPIFELHDVGLLVAMIPEFAPVIGRVHHDIYHVYTVDVHSVAAVDQLRAICRGDLATEHPLASRLGAELPRPRVLVFAALLHDVGKDQGGKGHPERGAEMSKTILERLGFEPSEIDAVTHHVREHLKMYHVATRRDIDDPKTIAEFCEHVRGVEGLRELYLLTLCDVTTTSPGSMTSWKGRMLDELYVEAERFLSDGGRTDDARPNATRRAALELWGGPRRSFVEHFIGAMPHRYLYANDAARVVAHARAAEAAMGKPASVTVLGTSEPYVELCVVAEDRPGLLAMITASFAKSKLKVLGAQVYSWVGPDGVARALDAFWVRSGQESAATLRLVPRIEEALQRLVQGELDALELVTGSTEAPAWSMRSTPPVETKVNIDNRSASNHTIIEVITGDRRGLLFWLSRALHLCGVSIALAKVNTEGSRVADVFYVEEPGGGKVSDPEKTDRIRRSIFETIASMGTGG
jgi:[protein-PII] uridylyltransferase